jgi:flagellar motor switch/type III secretory pathway protein FliN
MAATAVAQVAGPAVPATQKQNDEEVNQRWEPFLNLPCRFTVDLPVPGFRVSDFLQLHPGSVIGTQWRVTHDVPLQVNGTLIAWAELEGASGRLAVRVTELA